MSVAADSSRVLSVAVPPALVGRRPGWWRQMLRQRLAVTGLVLVGIFLLVALLGGHVAPYDFSTQHVRDRLQGPSTSYLLGTDEFGRDILSRILYGSRISLQVGFVAVGIAGSIGILIGLVSGYFGGWIDSVLMRSMDVLLAFPAILTFTLSIRAITRLLSLCLVQSLTNSHYL